MMGHMITPIPQVVDIFKPARVSDGQGGFTRTFQLLATMRGRVMPMSARERMIADTMSQESSHTCYLPPSAEIRLDYRIRAEGRFYEVKGVTNPGGFSHHQKVMLLEVTTDGE